jgi:hypothetical protein
MTPSFILALLATLAATSAAAEGLRVVPPKEYDYPYNGVVLVVQARDQNHVRELCPTAVFNTGEALGCAQVTRLNWGVSGCRIVMAPDDEIKRPGVPPDLVKRHEMAHCNGWPADHPDALPYEEWAERSSTEKNAKPCVKLDNYCIVGSPNEEWAKDPRPTGPCGIGIGKPCAIEPSMRAAAETVVSKTKPDTSPINRLPQP